MIKKLLILLMPIMFLQIGCAPVATIPQRQADVEKITLGFVQSKIKVGVSGEDVVAVLGSPNIVTTADSGNETWIYDKVSTDEEYVSGIWSGVKSKSTRTMMVVIRFDANKKVSSVQYRQTSY
jgi:outer membrane protein assembly factor BamE (lipoprotein component of BamABCDE complex)